MLFLPSKAQQFFVAQLIKNAPAVWETWVRSLGWEDPLEKGKALQYSGEGKGTPVKALHSSILAWRIPRTV